MVIPVIEVVLEDGRTVCIGTATAADAKDVAQFQLQTASETWFTGRSPEDCLSDEMQVRGWIENSMHDPNYYALFASVDGVLVGAATLEFFKWKHTMHRARMSIEVLREFWGTGVSHELMNVILQLVRLRPWVSNLELDVYELNHRAISFYTKYNFCVSSVLQDALRLYGDKSVNEYRMVVHP